MSFNAEELEESVVNYVDGVLFIAPSTKKG